MKVIPQYLFKAANMRGIFGLIVKNGHPMDDSALDTAPGQLPFLSESREKRAEGIALAIPGYLIAHGSPDCLMPFPKFYMSDRNASLATG